MINLLFVPLTCLALSKLPPKLQLTENLKQIQGDNGPITETEVCNATELQSYIDEVTVCEGEAEFILVRAIVEGNAVYDVGEYRTARCQSWEEEVKGVDKNDIISRKGLKGATFSQS